MPPCPTTATVTLSLNVLKIYQRGNTGRDTAEGGSAGFAATRLHSLAWGRMREQSVTPSRRGRRPKNFERARWSNKTKHYSGVLIVCFCFCTDGIHFAHYLYYVYCMPVWMCHYSRYLYARWMNFNVIVRMQRTCLYGAFTSLGPR